MATETHKYTGYVYEWINTKNGMWYIGSHDGSDPYYKAGGIAIKQAFKDFGISNFTRNKFYCSDYREQEDKALRRKDASRDPMSYNLKNSAVGGMGAGNKGRVHECSMNNDYLYLNKQGKEFLNMRAAWRSTDQKMKLRTFRAQLDGQNPNKTEFTRKSIQV